jgi:hypothetical protein
MIKLWINKIIQHKYFLLVFLWLVLTLVNIDKAFHIDDTFHLEASEYLLKHPLQPMSGLINWDNHPTPMHEQNQPPLFFYLIAIYSTLVGQSEIALHILVSIFTFLALYFFQKTATLINVKHKNLLLSIFALSPLFIINQNLMIDVPILSIVLGVLFFLLKAKKSRSILHYSIAAILLTLGLMMKYSVLPLIVVFTVVIILNKDYKKLIVLLIPVSSLLLWSAWNKIEYGSIHIIDRPSKEEFTMETFYAFIGCLGATSTFLITFLYATFKYRITKAFIYFITGAFILSVILFYFGCITESYYNYRLLSSFNIAGYLLLFVLLIHLIKLSSKNIKEYLLSENFVLLLFLGALSLFIILYAPFMATRHLLLVSPFLLLFTHELFDHASKEINILTLIATAALGILLGSSDWMYADYYRQMAKNITLKTDANQVVWSCGHWGWQWYSKKNEMRTYSLNEVKIRKGDYIVYPLDISKQKISEGVEMTLVDKRWKEATFLTLFSGNNFASLYNSHPEKLVWNLSKRPIDTIVVYKVTKGIEVNDVVKRIKSDQVWLESLSNTAVEMGISVDSIIVLNATWMLEQPR